MKYFIYAENYAVQWFTDEAEFEKAVDEFDFPGKFCDDGWSPEVENCLAGAVPDDFEIDKDEPLYDQLTNHATYAAEEFDRRARPDEEELDSGLTDKEGMYWGHWHYICNWRFAPVDKP